MYKIKAMIKVKLIECNLILQTKAKNIHILIMQAQNTTWGTVIFKNNQTKTTQKETKNMSN